VDNALETISGSGDGLSKVLSCNFLEGRGNPRETSAIITDVLAQIRTGHVPNTSLESYRYTILFRMMMMMIIMMTMAVKQQRRRRL
jgi:hypothetical protein